MGRARGRGGGWVWVCVCVFVCVCVCVFFTVHTSSRCSFFFFTPSFTPLSHTHTHTNTQTNRMEKTKQIKVDIPAGVNDGQKLRVKGEGDAGLKGGEAGDLYIFISVEKDPTFRRDGTDIYSDIRVSYVDAILGTKVKVAVIDGDAEISIKEGTQPGAILRLKGRGVPKLMSGDSSQRGDHYFTVGVDIPTSLSEGEREIIEQLRKEKESAEAKGGGGFFSGFTK